LVIRQLAEKPMEQLKKGLEVSRILLETTCRLYFSIGVGFWLLIKVTEPDTGLS